MFNYKLNLKLKYVPLPFLEFSAKIGLLEQFVFASEEFADGGERASLLCSVVEKLMQVARHIQHTCYFASDGLFVNL